MAQITLGREFVDGDQLTPTNMNDLVDAATVTGFLPSDFNLGSVKFFSYGNTRPALTRGAAVFDTTAGLEGMYFAFVSASQGSVAGWLCATPRRELYCWAASAVSLGTPLFIGRPRTFGVGQEYTVFDGCIFPTVYQFTNPSGADAAHFIALESVQPNSPVKCMWAGIIPASLPLLSGSAPPQALLYIDNTAPGRCQAAQTPSAKSIPIGVPLSGGGAILWGTGGAIDDNS